MRVTDGRYEQTLIADWVIPACVDFHHGDPVRDRLCADQFCRVGGIRLDELAVSKSQLWNASHWPIWE